jgi:uncharacterized repeat protein (TIGR01451 family)
MQPSTHHSSFHCGRSRRLLASVARCVAAVLLSLGLLGLPTRSATADCATDLQMSPVNSFLDFGDQWVGTTSQVQYFRLFNNGGITYTYEAAIDYGPGIPGPGKDDFTIVGSSSGTLGTFETVYIGVHFHPSDVGGRVATFDVQAVCDSGGSTSRTAYLRGFGIAAADLSVNTTATPDPVKRGKTLTYTTVVTNNGPSFASGVVLTQSLPAESDFVSATATQGGVAVPVQGGNSSAVVNLTGLASGSQVTLTLVVKITARAKTTVTSTASVSASTDDPFFENNTRTKVVAVFGSHK